MPARALSEIDRNKYGRLLARTAPIVVQTEEENERLFVGAGEKQRHFSRYWPEPRHQ